MPGVSIQKWQQRLATIYPNDDKTPDYMMAHSYTACADLGRMLLRNEQVPRRERAIVGVLSWLMAIANHFEINYEDALLRRFPGACSYCLSHPCMCDSTNKQAKHTSGRLLSDHEIEMLESKAANYRNANTVISFTWLASRLKEIYPSNRALLLRGGAGYVVGKMLEEGGELHRAYSEVLRGQGDKNDIAIELADLTAWVISCWDLGGVGRDLDSEFASAYSMGCRACHQVPCSCPSYSITMGQEDLLREIANRLRAVSSSSTLGEDTQKEVAEALQLVERTAKMPDPKNKRSLLTLLKKVSPALKNAESSVKSIESGAKAASGAVANFQELIEKFGELIP